MIASSTYFKQYNYYDLLLHVYYVNSKRSQTVTQRYIKAAQELNRYTLTPC